MARLDKHSSIAINLMKACSLIGVVSIHSKPEIDASVSHEALDITYYLVYQLQEICVPIFFMLSGYLFFLNLPKFDFSAIVKKWKSRATSLVIPYFIWCTIFALAFGTLHYIQAKFFGSAQALAYLERDLSLSGILSDYWDVGNGFPIDGPLWFVRNLIVFAACAPIVYFIGRYWILTAICIALPIFGIPTFSGELFIFGAALGIHQINPFKAIKRYILPICLLWLAANYLCNYSTKQFEVLFFVSGFIVLAPIFLKWAKRYPKTADIVNRHTPMFFFIYAIHFMYSSNIAEKIGRIIGTETAVGWSLSFIAATLLNIGIAVIMYMVAAKLLPGLTNMLCGGRLRK